MGFYSIYKILKDFLRHPFKVFIIVLLAFIIFSFFSSVFAADNHTDVIDVETCFQYEQELWNMNVINLMITHIENNYPDKSIIEDFLLDMSTGTRFFWIERFTGGRYVIFIYDVTDTLPNSVVRKTLWNSSTEFELEAYSMKVLYWIDFNVDTFSKRTDNDTYSCPKPCYAYRSSLFQTFLDKYYFHKTDIGLVDIYNEMSNKLRHILDAIQNLDNVEFKVNFTELIFALNKNHQETSQKIDEVKQEMKKTNDFLTDDNIDSSNVNIPGNSTGSNDPTSSGFNNIFNSFRDAFTKNISYETMDIPIPYTGKSIELRSDLLKNALGNNYLSALINAFWYYVFGLYIVKDVEKYVDKIKNGDIATSSETNIKTEML